VGEFVPGFEVSDWYGIGVRKKTPAEIVEKLNKEINAALTDPKLQARFGDLGGTVFAGSPADAVVAAQIGHGGRPLQRSDLLVQARAVGDRSACP
jgi:tripartite-type tricarboxylate transporter receptor subunit TctC